ncbi:hypothetical protein ST47_g7717 [Ascochyta rabiei]|uniref:Uncharacterized protein n=1 Tax=Didymella rabiei TaxID=5454 RepID=A0A163ADZ1_DIDRA|nr:hypothetical protein ST47_g7717 [Ascochyta rabiei]
MSVPDFDAQLLIPDNNASHQQLAGLIAAGGFTGAGLPDTAHRYLDVFCNKSYSNSRRRWAGIALAGMMRASASVVQRLKKLAQGLPRLGAVILDQNESEERRIIAGLIIRQGLEASVDFADFWESDKVLHSAPNFPRDAGEHWMGHFQTYLDTLGSLALANLNDDPLILYPMALSASDGFQWTGTSAVAIVERDLLTIVVSDSTLTENQFIDIPISHIKDTSLQQDSPHESQEGRSGHKMHALVINLQAKSMTYRLNSSDRQGSEFKVSFLSHEDADEFEVGICDARKTAHATTTAATDSTVSSSSLASQRGTDIVSSSKQQEDSPDDPEVDAIDESPDQPIEKQSPTQHAQDKGKGKLPKISYATKQKVKQLPPGRSKATRSRPSTKAKPVVYQDEDDDDDEETSEDEYDLQSKVPAHSITGHGTGRKPLGRRKPNIEDDEFVPAASKAKPKTAKRKRGSSDAGDNRPKKKTQTKTGDVKQEMKALDGAQAKPARARKPMKQSTQHNLQNEASSRHSLIGGLLNSKSPSKASAPAFKKPGQPASTPGRARAQPARTTPKPQTPVEMQDDVDLPVCIASSTPSSRAMHEDDFGVHSTPANSEILSSNSKRVPDSPHAESTAISGHANRDDVHREKRMGELEMARSDPFKQRQASQKISSFTRKLTGESVTNDGLDLVDEEPVDATHELKVSLANQPLLRQSPSVSKHRTDVQSGPHMQSAAARIRGLQSLSVKMSEARGAAAASHSETARKTDMAQDSRYRRRAQDGNRARANDAIMSGPHEAVEDTLADVQDQGEVEGDNTLVGEEMELPNQYGSKASELHFRSSPPMPDSSSVVGGLSDESEAEAEASPPTSGADEVEWEAALEPHQRALHEQLVRTSKRVVRHIVDNETAVMEIADVFGDDGVRVVDVLLERQGVACAEAFEGLESKRRGLLEELTGASRSLKAARQQVKRGDV